MANGLLTEYEKERPYTAPETRLEYDLKTLLFGILFSFFMLILFYFYNSHLTFQGDTVFWDPAVLLAIVLILFVLGIISYTAGRILNFIVPFISDTLRISKKLANDMDRINIAIILLSAFLVIVGFILIYPGLTKVQEQTSQDFAEGLSMQPVYYPLMMLGEIISYFFFGVITNSIRKYRIAEINKRNMLKQKEIGSSKDAEA